MNARNLLLCLILTCSDKLLGCVPNVVQLERLIAVVPQKECVCVCGGDCVSCPCYLLLKHIKDWEIMDDLQMDLGTGESLQDLSMPGICEGYLMKRRKWPLKGWHKVREIYPVPSA